MTNPISIQENFFKTNRYNYPLTKMANIKKTDDIKFWYEYEEVGILLHC